MKSVINNTAHPVELEGEDGDSVTVMPGRISNVEDKFCLLLPPGVEVCSVAAPPVSSTDSKPAVEKPSKTKPD